MGSLRISILGCGWLGFPLAGHLRDKGFEVKGATTTPEKISLLRQSGISPFLIECNPRIKGESIGPFFDSDILFLNIPFKRSLKDPAEYGTQMESVLDCLKSSTVKFLIFASSTSVYPSDIGLVSEEDAFIPETNRAKVLLEIEQMLLACPFLQTIVIRFAGLYGGTRRLSKFLAKRENVEGSLNPVNLIHLDDCIGIVTRIIELEYYGEILNACSDGHPSRQALYESAARREGLKPPIFSSSSRTSTKIVCNDKVKRVLNFNFKYPDPLRSVD